MGAVSLGLYVVATAFFPVEYLLGDALYAKALPVRLAIFAFAMLGYRCRYFGIWKISESICVVNGFGSVVVKDHETWDGCSNVEIVEFETTSDFSSMVHYWNCRIQKWLQMCIYERTNFNQVYVYIVSAFWARLLPRLLLRLRTRLHDDVGQPHGPEEAVAAREGHMDGEAVHRGRIVYVQHGEDLHAGSILLLHVPEDDADLEPG